jgi:N-sulfoglucosamine sulfohydrolase
VDSLVSHVDIFPTLCGLQGLDPPAWLQGESPLLLVQGETSATRDAVFAEVNYHASKEPMRSVWTKRWNYIRSYSDHPGTVLPNIDNSLSKLLLTDHDLASCPQPTECLYDLVFDPQETCNLPPGLSGPLDLSGQGNIGAHDFVQKFDA